jgi:hypothetical protein
MHWPETRQNVDMILNSADNLGHTVHAFDDPTEVRMKTWLPFWLNEGSSFFVREDEVIVQTKEG